MTSEKIRGLECIKLEKLTTQFWLTKGPIASTSHVLQTVISISENNRKGNGMFTRATWWVCIKERAIYYPCKKFTDYDSRYTVVEKLCCALVWAAKRLR